MFSSPYPTWVEINLSAIEENTRLVAEWTRVPLMGVVKDDGYGHGALEVGRAILGAGCIAARSPTAPTWRPRSIGSDWPTSSTSGSLAPATPGHSTVRPR